MILYLVAGRKKDKLIWKATITKVDFTRMQYDVGVLFCLLKARFDIMK